MFTGFEFKYEEMIVHLLFKNIFFLKMMTLLTLTYLTQNLKESIFIIRAAMMPGFCLISMINTKSTGRF